MLAQLQQYDPSLPDAEVQFAAALAKAKAEGKNVLIEVSSQGCAPCLLLSRYLDEQRELFEKGYVVLTIDRRFRNAKKVLDELEPGSGVPWMAILAPDRSRLATSDGPDGNIGFPETPANIAHFEKMLRQTSQRLTDADIRQLIGALQPKAAVP